MMKLVLHKQLYNEASRKLGLKIGPLLTLIMIIGKYLLVVDSLSENICPVTWVP